MFCGRSPTIHNGSSLFGRLGRRGTSEPELWDKLAPHIRVSEAARGEFLDYCAATYSPLGLRSLLALAQEQPSSPLLLKHCWRAFDQPGTAGAPWGSPWATRRTSLEVCYLLREHFRGSSDVLEYLRASFKQHPGQVELIALVLFERSDPALDRASLSPREIWNRHSDRLTALHLAAARSSAQEFTELLLDIINRDTVTDIWGFPDISNRAVLTRLRHDEEVVRTLRYTVINSPTASELASLPRYLLEAGTLDSALREHCSSRLQEESRRALPRAGYDAIESQVRVISQSLLDVLAPSFST
jgi:hypothetical protein